MTKLKEYIIDPIDTSFQGRDKSYTLEIFNSGNVRNGFTGLPEYSSLVESVQEVYLATYPNRDPDMSIERVRKSLSHPRTILILAKHDGIPVGYGSFPRFAIEGDQVMYSSRAHIREHESQGLGTFELDESIRLHNEELATARRKLVYGALYTQNPASIVSLDRSESTDNIRPFQRLHKPGGRYQRYLRPQRIMLEIHNSVFIHSTAINTITGVSKNELLELGENENYRPDRSREAAWNVYREMVDPEPEGLDMNIPQGHVVYVIYDIKAPSSTHL